MIVSCGEALVDVLPGGRVVPGGGPLNAAVAAARLGAPAAFVGRVSTDADGDRIWAHLQASGVELTAAQRGPEPTARAVVELAPSPVFRFEGEGTADASMTAVDLDPLGPGPHLLHGGTLGIFRGSTAGVLASHGWSRSTPTCGPRSSRTDGNGSAGPTAGSPGPT
jgi:fructokinase